MQPNPKNAEQQHGEREHEQRSNLTATLHTLALSVIS